MQATLEKDIGVELHPFSSYSQVQREKLNFKIPVV